MPRRTRLSFLVLYREELRALARGRFTFFGLAALFAFLGFIATVAGPEAGGNFVALFLSYIVVPSAFGAFAAVQIAGPRANKFVQAIFTAPVRRGSYFFAKLLVVLTVGVFYLLATFPLWVVYALTVGVPEHFYWFLLAGCGMILFGTAYGMFLGVAFTGRSVAAPVSLGVLPIFLIIAVPFMFMAGGARSAVTREILLRLAHLSPQVTLLDITQMQFVGVPKHPEVALTMFALSVGATLFLAAWIYLVHQSVESWEGKPGVRMAVVLLGVAAILCPTFAPAMEYTSGEGNGPSFGYRGEEQDGYIVRALLIARGKNPDPNLFMEHQGDPNLRFTMPGTTQADLLVMFFDRHDANITRITINAVPGTGLVLRGASNVVFNNFVPTQFLRLGNENERAFYVRVPVTAEPREAAGLRGINYGIQVWTNVTTTFVPPEPQPEPPVPQTEPGRFFFTWSGQYTNPELRVLPLAASLPVLFLFVGIVRSVRRR